MEWKGEVMADGNGSALVGLIWLSEILILNKVAR